MRGSFIVYINVHLYAKKSLVVLYRDWSSQGMRADRPILLIIYTIIRGC
jgi:hypothetical protein